jgi:hypothetical protein
MVVGTAAPLVETGIDRRHRSKFATMSLGNVSVGRLMLKRISMEAGVTGES